MEIVIETARLWIVKFTAQDAAFIRALVNMPAWLQFIGDRNVHNDEDAVRYLENGPIKSYDEHGFGAWKLVEKSGGHDIGMCGIFQRTYLDHPDIGFALLTAYEGKGYAFEAAQACCDYVRSVYNVETLGAFTAMDNHASMKLLRKLGFESAGTLMLEGEELNLFKKEMGV